jgi:mannose/fructose/N-acetylgalactosamine-specific phosphotransferase system component IID
LIAAQQVKMAKSAIKAKGEGTKGERSLAYNLWPLALSLAAALLIWLGHVNPVWVILATIVLTIIGVSVTRNP